MPTKGIIFDIQRFCIHDGPGIRTTVFLKGCYLKCIWCHNPESISPGIQVNSFNKLNPKPIGREITVDEVIKEVMRDLEFYKNSGGGITLSGGEPLYQFEFTKSLLITAKESGLHTCIETSGFAKQAQYEEIRTYVDMFLLDYKATGEEDHIRLTGVSGKPILDNLDYLYKMGSKIHLRCPLVPGVNDGDEHLRAIAELSKKYKDLHQLEIMPFHSLGAHKWRDVGLEYLLEGLDSASAEQIEKWKQKLMDYGCLFFLNS